MFRLPFRKADCLDLGPQHESAATADRAHQLAALLKQSRHRISPGHR